MFEIHDLWILNYLLPVVDLFLNTKSEERCKSKVRNESNVVRRYDTKFVETEKSFLKRRQRSVRIRESLPPPTIIF